MKQLLLILIAIATLSSCSKREYDITVEVTEKSAFHQEHILFDINAEFYPEFGENLRPFTLNVIVTATSDDNTITEIVTLTEKDFIGCGDKAVYGKGHRFNTVVPLSEQDNYEISFTKQIKFG